MDSENLSQIIVDFNSTLLDFVNNIAAICPDSIIGANAKDICKAIDKPANERKFIEVFVGCVLIYKPQIDAGDDNFFLNKSYDEDLQNGQATLNKNFEINSKSDNMINKVFEFKTIWGKLNRTNKDIVIQYMKLLCELAQQYFEIYVR